MVNSFNLLRLDGRWGEYSNVYSGLDLELSKFFLGVCRGWFRYELWKEADGHVVLVFVGRGRDWSVFEDDFCREFCVCRDGFEDDDEGVVVFRYRACFDRGVYL